MIETHQIQIDGANIFYKTVGDKSKQTAVFLHGWPGTMLAKSKLLEELAKDYFVIAPIHPGYLESEPLKNYYNILDQYADVLFSVLTKEGKEKEKIFLIGQSFGATIASSFASRYEKNIHTLVFTSGLMCTKKQDILRKILWHHGVFVIRAFMCMPAFLERAGLFWFFGMRTGSKSWRYNHELARIRVGLIANATRIFRESMRKDGNLLDRPYGNFPIIFCQGDTDGKNINVYGYSPMGEGEKLFEKLKNQGKRVDFIELKGGHDILYKDPKYVLEKIKEVLSSYE